jgi:hypothetical protein
MRIEYTIPGWQPTPQTGVGAPAAGSDFHSKLRELEAPQTVNWRSVLRLDKPAPSAAALTPPPRPADAELATPAEQSRQWHDLLLRGDQWLAGQSESAPEGSDLAALQKMQGVLMGFQEMEDTITTRRLMETRG